MRRTVALLLALLMTLSILAGCAKKTETPTTTDAAANGTGTKVFQINYWLHQPWTRNPLPEKAQNWADTWVKEKYGLDWTLQIAPADGAEAKLNAMIAGGNVPDLISGDYNLSIANLAVNQWIQQGVIVPLDDYLKEFPKLKTALPDSAWPYLQRNGKTYGVGTAPDPNYETLWIRKDWLDKLGLKVPTTVEELASVAKAFATGDPDGNGKPDTYGISTAGWNSLKTGPIFAPFGVQPAVNRMYLKDNKLVFAPLSPEAKLALTWWNDLVKAGAVDPDWSTNKVENHKEAAVRGRVGIVATHFLMDSEFPSGDAWGKDIKAVNPNAKWVQIPSVKGPFGTYANWERTPINTIFMVTRKGAEDPAKLKQIMRLLNDMIDPTTETHNMLVWGRAGEHHEAKDGKVFARLADHPDLKWLQYYRNIRSGTTEYWSVLFAKEKGNEVANVKTAFSAPLIPNVTGLVRPHTAMPDLMKYVEEMHTKFSSGQEPLANWDSFVQNALTKYKGQEVLDDATKQLKELGLIK